MQKVLEPGRLAQALFFGHLPGILVKSADIEMILDDAVVEPFFGACQFKVRVGNQFILSQRQSKVLGRGMK